MTVHQSAPHGNALPLCKNCFYFHPVSAIDPLLSGKGECWRYPPRTWCSSLTGDEHPLADEGGHCGEFRSRREVIASFRPEGRQLYRVKDRE